MGKGKNLDALGKRIDSITEKSMSNLTPIIILVQGLMSRWITKQLYSVGKAIVKERKEEGGRTHIQILR